VSSASLAVFPSSFTDSYQQTLKKYVLAEAGEEALMLANDLGRRAVNEHCNILELVEMHQQIILKTVLTGGADQQIKEYLRRGEEFLAEVMAPFEMMHRSFDATIRQLQQVNASLEQRVEERTRALQDSQRKTADLARLYRILSSINSTIVRLRDRTELFNEACRIAVEKGGYQAAWISMVEEYEQLATDTWCRRTDSGSACQIDSASPLAIGIGNDMDLLHRQGKPVVSHRLKKGTAPLADTDFDFASYALLPLILEGKTIGSFALFSAEPDAFDCDEMRLLTEMAGDLSFALDHIQKEEQLNYLAYYDSLTGLPNQNLLLAYLSLQLQAAQRVDGTVALLLIKLMHFSDISGIYGRHIGDNVLIQVGERLRRATGNQETVAKVGGDRFAISLTGLVDTDQVAHRLEQEIMNSFVEPFMVDDTEIHITAQVGISLFPSDGTDPDTLYKNGEMALKLAQIKGEPYLLYNSAMNERIIRSVTMESKLRKAIDQGELVLNYQPKVSAVDGHLVSMEALIRYADPEEGLVLPGRFIPLMEGTGMIIKIGNWVIQRAAQDLQNWRQLQLDPPRIAVNVSAFQLRQKDFFTSLVELLPADTEDHGLDMEITESAIMDDMSDNIPKLQAVRDLGFGIAIDDFGTGYSSLSYLSRLPVNALKIDRSFIVDMTERPNSLAIVTTIITLAHSLELEVIAEGVDREEQAKLLRLLRCDLIQGNLYSPPLTGEQMTELLQQQHH